MAKEYLIDTSAVIKYLNESLINNGLLFIDGIINDNCGISFISEIELQVWNPPNEADLAVYKAFVYHAEIIGVNDRIIAETINYC